MNATGEVKHWSNLQTYSLAFICLLVGLATGYLLHPPQPAQLNAPSAATGMPQTAPGAMNGGVPTPEQMKQMADKKAGPMLAALQKEPNNSELLAQVGSVYFHTQQFAAAQDYYTRSLKAKPTADGYVNLANAYYYGGSGDQALAALNHALELDPKSADALFNLGMLNWQLKNNPQGAIDAWQRLIQANPSHPHRADVEKMIAQVKEHMNMPAGSKVDKPVM
jgi:cytochrome c-type biogenesis protein CcmH/NrfG